MPSVDDPQNVEHSLRVLASLPSQRPVAKVKYKSENGRLPAGNWVLFRSASDSVTSPDFSNRMTTLFTKANSDIKYHSLCENAFNGLK